MRRVMRFFAVLTSGFNTASLAQSPKAENVPRAPSERQISERINAGTVGLAGGLLEGAPIRFATEIARVVNESDKVHVLPIVTRGPTENVNDLLYLKGVDLAIINTDSLEEYKTQVPQIQQRIVSIINLFPSELHIFVRPEIKSLADLAGKKVNFNTQGTAAAYSGPLIFSRLGVAVDKMFIPHPLALEQLKRGEIAGVVFITSKPVDPFVKGKWDDGFKFLPVEFGPKFSDYYVASSLESSDYPNLIAKGERVATIAVPTILASYNWKPETPRYRRVERFVEEFFSRVEKLKAPGFDPKWKDMDVKQGVPGIERARSAQNWIDRSKTVKHSELSR
jgi:NMT1 family protein